MSKSKKQEYKLVPDTELRFEVDTRAKRVTLELTSGAAEIFGAQLVLNQKYEFFPGSNIAVFTWQGCNLRLEGSPKIVEIAKETPMILYLNCHAVFEELRELAEKENKKGPIVMIVGPCDVGKSTICRILVNYALRLKRKPIFVNLDVGQVEFAVPGTLGALLLDKPSTIDESFSEENSLVFHYGYTSPQHNEKLYKLLITRTAEVCCEQMKLKDNVKHSGVIINTSGYITNEGFSLLGYVAQNFEVDAILVIHNEELYNNLIKVMPDFVKVVLLPKSSGVVVRTQGERAEARNEMIHRYFYGFPQSTLTPYKINLKFDDFTIYKIGVFSSTSKSVKTSNSNTQLIYLQPIPQMKRNLLSVSFASSDKDDIVQSNVAGFLLIEDVNVEKKILSVLSPQPRLMPKSILLLSDVKYTGEL